MLLPSFGIDPNEWSIGFDPRRVRVLQGDRDKLAQRISLEYSSGIIDRYRAKSELGYVAEEEDRGVYYEMARDFDAKEDQLNPANRGRDRGTVPPGDRKD
jgi:hypothetical protein